MDVRSELRKPSPDFKSVYAAFAKVDEDQRMVFGYATTETRDQQGEIVKLTAVEAALPGYMQFANIREMHQPKAVGTAEEASVDGKGFWVGAKIVDDDAWKKVRAKVYKGFSIGGRVTSRDTIDRSVITGLELTEVSVVDRPANPDAVFTVVKRVNGILQEQPTQKWDCGDAAHQHKAKADASECMAKRAAEIRKKAQAATAAGLALHNAASEVETLSKDPVEKREFSDKEREEAADAGQAMPDGSFPIKTKEDLSNAIQAVGRAKNPARARAHIKSRARALGAADMIPETWKAVADDRVSKEQGRDDQGRFAGGGEAHAQSRFAEKHSQFAKQHDDSAAHRGAAQVHADAAEMHREEARSAGSRVSKNWHNSVALYHDTMADYHAARGRSLATEGKAVETGDLAKAAPREDGSGRFSTHDRLAAQAHKKRAHHDKQAAKARDEEKMHRAAAERSVKAGDARAVALHEQLAGAAASLADAHGRAAEKYREVAARHESAIGKLKKEIDMSGTAARSITDAENDATTALTTLTKALSDDVEKIDHAAKTREAREQALGHIKDATSHEEEAASSREDARTARSEGKTDEATAHDAEADVSDMTAAGNHEVADTLHELHAHHAEAMHKSAGEGFDYAAHADHAMEVGKAHAADAQHAATMSTLHKGMASGYIGKADMKKSFDHHTEMAGKYDACVTKRQGLAKRMTDLHTACQASNAEKVAKAASAAAAAAKVIPVTGLKQTEAGWVDVSGASFFGKREIKDDARKAMVEKGMAMPDGSFPIETEEDLGEACKAFSMSKESDRAAVQALITKRAGELKKEVKFEGAMATIVTPMGATKTPDKKDDPAPGASEAARQAAGVQTGLPADTKGVEKGTAGEQARQAAGIEANLAAGTKGVEKSAARVSKGMGIISRLAGVVAEIESMVQSSEMEQLYEGDKDCPIPAALRSLCEQAMGCLKTAVEHETSEVTEGTDVEMYAAAAKTAVAAGVLRIAKMLREGSLGKDVDAKKRVGLKKIADSIEKVASEVMAKAATAAPSADEAKKLAAAIAERDTAVKALDRFTGTVTAITTEVKKMRADQIEDRKLIEKANAEITRLGGTPLPAKGRVAQSGIQKVDVVGDGIRKFDDAAPGAERAFALLNEGEALRSEVLRKAG